MHANAAVRRNGKARHPPKGEKFMAANSRICMRCVLVLVLTCSVLVSGQTKKSLSQSPGTLTGDISDSAPAGDSGPIPYAAIFLRGFGTTAVIPVKVDEKGKFKAVLPPGLYDVFVGADGFAPTCKVVSIESDKTTNFSPRLGPDSEHVNGVV